MISKIPLITNITTDISEVETVPVTAKDKVSIIYPTIPEPNIPNINPTTPHTSSIPQYMTIYCMINMFVYWLKLII